LLAFLSLLILASANSIPRLKFNLKVRDALVSEKVDNYSVLFHDEGSNVVYVGGPGTLHILTFNESLQTATHIQIPIAVGEKAKKTCQAKATMNQDMCENVITVIQKMNESFIIICGSNAGAPRCWFLKMNETQLERNPAGQAISVEVQGISSVLPSQRSITLAVDGNLYSASNKDGGSIRRSYGQKKQVKTEGNWLHNAEFVSSALIPRKNKTQQEIYFFFSEKKMAKLDEDPVRAWIGRVCEVDEGGQRAILQESWTTFLKARLLCGYPSEFLNFNQIQDAAVVMGEEAGNGIVFGIFASAWNSTVVCAYSTRDISRAFSSSKLKGFTGSMPSFRPGTCASPSVTSSLHKNILNIIKDNPELEEPIQPLGHQPLYTGKHEYTKVAVTRVQAANNSYNILFLGTAKGKIHKVLHSNEGSFIISELSLFGSEEPIFALSLDTITGHLYVGTASEITRLPLADCERYGETCRKCVAARDPYCGWNRASQKCSSIQESSSSSSEFLQNIERLDVSICEDAGEPDVLQEDPKEVVVDSTSFVYLPCPVRSYHAIYTWYLNDGSHYPCTINGDSCTLQFSQDIPMTSGIFKCTATEQDMKEEIAVYKLVLNNGRVWRASLAQTMAICLPVSTFFLL
uniref:Semaphorin-1A n=1 Tax=Latimeria chalumnae TaxID=7897 RepID=H3BDX5_LATCH